MKVCCSKYYTRTQKILNRQDAVFASNDEHGYFYIIISTENEIDHVKTQKCLGKYSPYSGDLHIKNNIDEVEIIFLDESGWLETYGLGWYGVLKEIRLKEKPLIVVVRPDLKNDLVKFWNIDERAVLSPKSNTEEVQNALDCLTKRA